jgi:imidazolonepropionase-like amidohydrolase
VKLSRGPARIAVAAGAVLALLAASEPRANPRAASPTAFAITHASVIPMDSERVLHDHTVLVVGDRVAAVGPDGAVALPQGTPVVDVRGAYVTPGLIDMHVHIRRSELRAYVESGITSVRNMWGYNALPATMQAVASGELLGPTIYSASQGIDASPGVWPETQFVDEPSQAAAVVAAQVAAGWRFLKIYNSLSLASYDAIVAAARSHGIRFVGHVSNAVPIEHALDSGQASIEHLRGYDHALTRGSLNWAEIDASRIPGLATHTASVGAWNCPTMAIYELIGQGTAEPARSRIRANRQAMVRALRDAGARLLAGSDAGIDRTAAGTSLHDELADLVAAGLSPYESIRAATSGGAEFLEETAEIGTVAAGRRADLLVIAGNPLEDVAALRDIEAVILRGSWHPAGGRRSPLLPRAPERQAAPRELPRPER